MSTVFSENLVLRLRFASEQILQRARYVLSPIENRMDLIDDRGRDFLLPGQVVGGAGSGIALGHTPGVGENGLEFLAPSQALAQGTIPAKAGKAGHGQVAQTAQDGEGFGLRPARHAEPTSFDTTPRKKSRRCV